VPIIRLVAQAALTESQAAYTLSTGRYLGATAAELDAADAVAAQAASSAAAQTGAIWAADTFGSPWVQTFVESWLDKVLGLDPSEPKHCPSGSN